MSRTPFPEVATVEELGDVWAADFVECSGCVVMVPLLDDRDPVEWAKEHRRRYPSHVGYRTHSITNFSVPEPADEPAL